MRLPLRKVQPIRPTPTRIVSQQLLKKLRDLKQIQREMLLLESEMAGEVMRALQGGADVEMGELRVKIVTRQRGNRREQKLVVY